GRATDQAILTGRLIDRPLRPSFPAGFRNEVHVVGTILGADQENPHDVLAINAASAALMVSGIPFDGPIGAVRIAWSQDGSWIPHPTYQEGDESTFELVVAGRSLGEDGDGDVAIMMVEAGGTENAWSYYEAGATIAGTLEEELSGREREVKAAVRALTKQLVRRRIVEDGVRIDGRGPRDIRPLSAEVGVIPTAHGSGLFQRGETQVLNVTTLGMPRMEQMLDTIGIDESKRYMHHYNMPPFATGETGFMRGPKRREIGHGL